MYYHGTSIDLGHKLLSPSITGVIQEVGRKKNLNKVFFTDNKGLAKIYSGRSKNVNGGIKRLYRVIPMAEVTCLSKGVYFCDWAFVEEIK